MGDRKIRLLTNPQAQLSEGLLGRESEDISVHNNVWNRLVYGSEAVVLWMGLMWCGCNAWIMGKFVSVVLVRSFFMDVMIYYLGPKSQELLLYGPSDLPSSTIGTHYILTDSNMDVDVVFHVLFPLAQQLGFANTLQPPPSSWLSGWMFQRPNHGQPPVHHVIPISPSSFRHANSYLNFLSIQQPSYPNIYNVSIHCSSSHKSQQSPPQPPLPNDSIWKLCLWFLHWMYYNQQPSQPKTYFISIQKFPMPHQQPQDGTMMEPLQLWLQQQRRKRPFTFQHNSYYHPIHQHTPFPILSFLYLALVVPFCILPFCIIFSFPLLALYTSYYITKLLLQTIILLPLQTLFLPTPSNNPSIHHPNDNHNDNHRTTTTNTLTNNRRNGVDSVDSSSSTPFFPTTPFGSPSSHTSWYPLYTPTTTTTDNNNMKPSQHQD